jgi:hypothetical protein
MYWLIASSSLLMHILITSLPVTVVGRDEKSSPEFSAASIALSLFPPAPHHPPQITLCAPSAFWALWQGCLEKVWALLVPPASHILYCQTSGVVHA